MIALAFVLGVVVGAAAMWAFVAWALNPEGR